MDRKKSDRKVSETFFDKNKRTRTAAPGARVHVVDIVMGARELASTCDKAAGS